MGVLPEIVLVGKDYKVAAIFCATVRACAWLASGGISSTPISHDCFLLDVKIMRYAEFEALLSCMLRRISTMKSYRTLPDGSYGKKGGNKR